MTERTPSTRAGRDLLGVDALSEPTRDGTWDAILAIETEARADALREVGERLALLEVHEFETPSGIGDERYFPDMLDRAEVLDTLKAQPPAPDPT